MRSAFAGWFTQRVPGDAVPPRIDPCGLLAEETLWHLYRHTFCMPVGYEPLRLIQGRLAARRMGAGAGITAL